MINFPLHRFTAYRLFVDMKNMCWGIRVLTYKILMLTIPDRIPCLHNPDSYRYYINKTENVSANSM